MNHITSYAHVPSLDDTLIWFEFMGFYVYYPRLSVFNISTQTRITKGIYEVFLGA